MKTGNNKAVAYIRVSKEDQNLSIEVQEPRLRAYAVLRDLDIVEVIIDHGVSGATPMSQRPGGARLIEMVRTKAVTHVVGYKLDRLFRNCLDCLNTTDDWSAKGIALHLVDMGGQALDTASPIGRFLLTVLAGAAEFERNLIADRTKSALKTRRSKSLKCSRHPPYGYSFDGDNIIENPTEQTVVKAVQDLRAQGFGYRKIVGQLNGSGFRTRAGSEFVVMQVVRMLRRDEISMS